MSHATDELLKGYDPRAAAPFVPPVEGFPEWMLYPAPRPLPPEYVQRKRREKRNITQILFALAAITLAASYLPVTAIAGQYFVPFAYLGWIGWTFAGLAALIGVLPLILEDNDTKAVINGHPAWARIERLGRGPKSYKNGKPDKFHYQALVICPSQWHAGVIEPQLVGSRELVGLEGTECTYRPGDYVIVFRQSNDVTLYGFSGVAEREGIVETSSLGWWQTASWLIRCGIFLFLAVTAISAFRYAPLEMGWNLLIPVFLGVLFACGVIPALLVRAWFAASEVRERRERNAARRSEGMVELGPPNVFKDSRASVVFSLLLLIGTAFIAAPAAFLLFSFHLNAAFDRTPERPVHVDAVKASRFSLWYVIRVPKVSYTWNGHEYFLLMTTEEIEKLKDAPRATLFVREGNFGWPWVVHADPRP